MIAARLRIATALVAGLLLALPSLAQAADTYVDDDSPGNPPGGCFTPANPCRSIVGVDSGLFHAGPGDTVFIDGGFYDESFILGSGKSLVYQEFGTPDPPAIIDGGTMPPIVVLDSTTAGTVQGLTLRGGSGGSLQAFGPVTVTGNTFDEDGNAFASHGSLHLEDDATQWEVSGNTFIDPGANDDDRFGIKAVLSGTATVTVTDNTFTGLQEGVHLEGTANSAEVSRNTFTGTHARSDETAPGVGIHLDGILAFAEGNVMSSPNVFIGGTTGVQASNGSLALYRNRIREHSTGVNACDSTFATLNGDVIYGNGVGVFVNDCGGGDPVLITSTTLWGNSFADVHMLGGEVQIDSSILSNEISKAGSATTPFICSIDFSRGATTAGADPDGCDGFQTSADPAFVNPSLATGDFHLTPGSPMVDAGNPGLATFMVFDPDGDPRSLDGDCDGVARPDIGADELARDCTTAQPTPPAAGQQPAKKKRKCKKGRKLKRGKCVKMKRKRKQGKP